jgi:hypothetical protein
LTAAIGRSDLWRGDPFEAAVLACAAFRQER